MTKSRSAKNKTQTKRQTAKKRLTMLGVITVLILAATIKFNFVGKTSRETGPLTIFKSELSETAKFYPYQVGKTNLEVLAVKASDGTIRTAFNTCQVCYASGRGYYQQQGDELICQNCGNRFYIDQVEKVRGGCNPVPIFPENKTEDETKIVIAQEYLASYQGFFANWRK